MGERWPWTCPWCNRKASALDMLIAHMALCNLRQPVTRPDTEGEQE